MSKQGSLARIAKYTANKQDEFLAAEEQFFKDNYGTTEKAEKPETKTSKKSD